MFDERPGGALPGPPPLLKGPTGVPEPLPCVDPWGLLEPGPVLIVIPPCVLEGVIGLWIWLPLAMGALVGGHIILPLGPQLLGGPLPDVGGGGGPPLGPNIGPLGPAALEETGGQYIGPEAPLDDTGGGP